MSQPNRRSVFDKNKDKSFPLYFYKEDEDFNSIDPQGWELSNKPDELRKVPLRHIVHKEINEQFPFKSKIKYFDYDVPIKATPPDFTLAPLKKLYRPYFSPKLGSWEIDVVYAPSPDEVNKSKLYLFCVNINTKFLVVFPIKSRHKKVIEEKLNILRKYHYVSNIRGDGEFAGWVVKGEVVYSSSSPFDNHNRVVDRVIRTIRDGVGQNYYDFRNYYQVEKVVDFYNETPHLSLKINKAIFTPLEVENNPELEGVFIRKNQEVADFVTNLQKELFDYKPGNILLVHLDFSKTPMKFMKKRRNFNALAEFIEYQHGNVVARVLRLINLEIKKDTTADKSLDVNLNDRVIIPVYFTKFVCERSSEIPLFYESYFE